MKTTALNRCRWRCILLSGGMLLSVGCGRDSEQGKERTSESKKDQALHNAAWDGELDAVKRLLRDGADVNAKGQTGNTPLYVAAWHGHIEVVEFLIKEGAEVNLEVEMGATRAYQIGTGCTRATGRNGTSQH
ncbi:MAG: ankyrin repeat domain-containing protein [Planctomycetes bacterium]|nr:ankyrin repeat domain-containing protein [Planctomycetota bacterium]